MLVSIAFVLTACSAAPPEAIPAPPDDPAPTTRSTPRVEAVGKPVPGKRRIVAIGDLHGDLNATLEVLQLAGLTDHTGKWVGGDTVFVQTGDLTDRGPDSKGVVDLMRRIQQEAPKSGGVVHLLNGNHEVMNLQGDWRYVSPEDIAGFGGKLERLTAFAPTGEYGAFLAQLPVSVIVDDTVFVHGGIHPQFAVMGLDEMNHTAKEHYFDPPEVRHPINGEQGPTWFRGFVRAPEEHACPVLDESLQALGVKRMIVGHTPTKGEMNVRCNGRLTVVDMGISAHYGHHIGAWEAIDGDARVLLPSGPQDIPDP